MPPERNRDGAVWEAGECACLRLAWALTISTPALIIIKGVHFKRAKAPTTMSMCWALRGCGAAFNDLFEKIYTWAPAQKHTEDEWNSHTHIHSDTHTCVRFHEYGTEARAAAAAATATVAGAFLDRRDTVSHSSAAACIKLPDHEILWHVRSANFA